MTHLNQVVLVIVILSQFRAGAGDAYDIDSCSKDKECETVPATPTQQIIPQETKALMDAVAAVQLYKAQEEVAKYLELAYITLSDHPDQATEVRMTAHSARTQHTMTSELMKTFMVTAAHIDPDMIKDLFDKIIVIADNMKTEVEETKARYNDILLKVQENFASVNKKNTQVVDREKRLELEKEREGQEAQAAKQEEKELAKIQEEMDEEIQELRENRNMWREEAAFAGRNMDEDDFTMFDIPLGAAHAFTAGGWSLGLLQSFISIAKGVSRSYNHEKQKKHFMDAYKESQENLDRTIDKRREIKEKRSQKQNEALRRLSKIKQIIQEEVGLGDAESLREATIYLGQVDGLFSEIILYWGHMANVIKVIREESTVGDIYLRKMENPAYAAKLKKQLEKEEHHWKFFGRICKDNTIQTDTEIRNLYKFLTDPIDKLALNKRKQRQQQLFLEIEAEINGEFVDDEY